MHKVLKNIPDDELRAYIVWLPMFPGDSRDWAKTRSGEFSDRRLTYSTRIAECATKAPPGFLKNEFQRQLDLPGCRHRGRDLPCD